MSFFAIYGKILSDICLFVNRKQQQNLVKWIHSDSIIGQLIDDPHPPPLTLPLVPHTHLGF